MHSPQPWGLSLPDSSPVLTAMFPYTRTSERSGCSVKPKGANLVQHSASLFQWSSSCPQEA